MKFDTMLFDLDGTLVDTAPDLALALNHTLFKNGYPEKDFKDIRGLVSRGGKELIKLGFKIDEKNINFNKYHQQFLEFYQNNIAINSQLFSEMDSIIDSLKYWGIVTNKPTNLATSLLKKLSLNPDILVCGDSLKYNKPHPKPILFAMQKLGVKNCAFVGDSIVDMQAANSANITAIAVSYGYETPQKNWKYHHLISQPIELKQWIK